MNKKTIAIIVGTLAVLAIVLISIFGIQPENRDDHRNVLKIEVLTPGVEPTTYLDEDNSTLITTLLMQSDTTEYIIEWLVRPTNATNPSVTFTSNNTSYATVSNIGVVSFLQEESVQITIQSVDKSSIKAIVNFVFPSPSESFLNVDLTENNVNFELQTDAHLLHSYFENQLILLEGATYTFGIGENIALSIAQETSATLDNNILSTNQSEEFTMTLTQTIEEQDDVVKTVSVKVIPYVSVFNMGSQYKSYLDTMVDFAKSENEQETEFLNKTITPYLVGSGNDYYFNILLRRPNDQTLTQSEIELVYTVKNSENENVELSTIATLNGNNLQFNENAEGNIYTFTVLPKLNEIFNRLPLTFTFQVNDGMNIWTSNELYNNFKNLEVSSINLHSLIVATPRQNQLVTVNRTIIIDGTPTEVEETRLNNYWTMYKNDALREDAGTLYPRFIPSTYANKNEIALNGNFFTIDASSVPLFNFDGRSEQAGSLDWADDLASVQEGLFQVNDMRTLNNPENQTEEVYASATYNNLIIRGNSAKGPIYTLNDQDELTSEEEVNRLTEQGSGLPILMTRGSIMTVNNVVASNSLFTFWSASSKARMELNDTKSYDIWGGAIYGYGTSEIELTNIHFSRIGGTAISYEDSTYSDWLNPAYSPEYLTKIQDYTKDYLDLILTFNENVVIDNYLTGDEGWFIVNKFNSAVPLLKGMVDPTLNTVGKSMIKHNETDQFNYILQITSSDDMRRPGDTFNDNIDIQYTIKQVIGYNDVTNDRIYRTTVRKNGFKSAHPFTSLDDANGAYLGSIGSYSNLEDFKQLQHTIAIINGYLTNDANIKAIYTNFDASIGLGTVIENIYQSLVHTSLLNQPFTGLDPATQQLVLLGISGYQSADGTIDVNVMAKNLLDTYASYDSATAGYIRSQAEASDDTKMGAFAIGLIMDEHKATGDILEILPPAIDVVDRQLALFVEYFDLVAQ